LRDLAGDPKPISELQPPAARSALKWYMGVAAENPCHRAARAPHRLGLAAGHPAMY